MLCALGGIFRAGEKRGLENENASWRETKKPPEKFLGVAAIREIEASLTNFQTTEKLKKRTALLNAIARWPFAYEMKRLGSNLSVC